MKVRKSTRVDVKGATPSQIVDALINSGVPEKAVATFFNRGDVTASNMTDSVNITIGNYIEFVWEDEE